MGTSYTALMVKKGNVAFKIAPYGKLPIEKKKAVEKALAQQVVSKLRRPPSGIRRCGSDGWPSIRFSTECKFGAGLRSWFPYCGYLDEF
jgi:hypothetical protein